LIALFVVTTLQPIVQNDINAQPITNGETEKESLIRYMVSGGLSNLSGGENIG
jgi:hypothetical protein